jgi:hypothetical protein
LSPASRSLQTARTVALAELGIAVMLAAAWIYLLVSRGVVLGVESVWALAISGYLGTFALLTRLRFDESWMAFEIGPWRREVDLTDLESVTWRRSGTYGLLWLRDRRGRRVPIYVGKLRKPDQWSKVILEAAARTGAHVDERSRDILRSARADSG